MAVTLTTDRLANRVAVLGCRRLDAVLIGVSAFVVSVAGAGRPSTWVDEAATISASTRSVPQMWALLGQVDAVHGLHYLLMRGWFSVFPATEFWARVPSSLLIGGAAAGLVVLASRLSTRSVAIAAGVVMAVLPRTTWAGVEARSYALSIFDAVWLTVLCLVAVRRDRRWIWAAYCVGLVLATVANVFVLFVVAAHAVLVLGTARSRPTVTRWAGSVLVAIVAVAPFVQLLREQKSRVEWIVPVGPGTLGQILGDQYFPAVYSSSARASGIDPNQQVTGEQVAAAVHAWGLVAPFIVGVVVVVVLAWRRRGGVDGAAGDDPRLLAVAAVVGVLAPTAMLVGYSVIGDPLYQPHYLSFTAPFLALLIGLCVVVVGHRPRRIAVILLLLVLAAVPNYVAQRGPYAKFGMDYSQVAELVAAQSSAGDCLSLDDTAPTATYEGLVAGHRGSFRTLRDDGGRRAIEQNALFDTPVPIAERSAELRTCPALWTITERDDTLSDHQQGARLDPGGRLGGVDAYRVPTRLGFRVVERWQFNVTQVVKSVPTGR